MPLTALIFRSAPRNVALNTCPVAADATAPGHAISGGPGLEQERLRVPRSVHHGKTLTRAEHPNCSTGGAPHTNRGYSS